MNPQNPIEEIVEEHFEMRKKNPRNYDWLAGWLRTKLHALVEKTRKEVIDEIAGWAEQRKKDFADDLDIADGPRIFANSLLDDLLTTLRMREK